MYSLMDVNNLDFFFTKEQDDNEDFKIKIVSNTKQNIKEIKSLILDVFNFDLEDFKTKIGNYDIMQDMLFPDKEKPYTKQDMLEHIILF